MKRASLLLLSASVLAPGCLAESASGFDRHQFALQAGYFLSSWNTGVSVQGEARRNPQIDLEEDLGFDEDDETYLLGLEWRFARRHKMVVGYWDFRREAKGDLQRDITLGDTTFPLGISVGSEWDISIVPVTYNYAFYDTEALQIRASVGAHWTGVELGVRARTDSGNSGAGVRRQVSAKADAPLPVIGGGLRYRPWQNWELGADGGWFGLSLDISGGDVEGDIVTANAYVEYSFTDNLSAGLKYTYFDMDIDIDKERWDGGVEFEYSGPQVYLGLRF
ncbi:outer membrane protein [Parahaliea aestuarii]|uniref:Outer membrane beta-barrel protein n=1 Tax=Parahaliea aestuarii TaxID=1852021 RepID=A0A5C8ZXD7_9GAMM|nr:hypothetical protein [Parahaliea aestuarii]TXS93185.1 hypothetical protein FVW59_04855 [Parahaliea aestuarii]